VPTRRLKTNPLSTGKWVRTSSTSRKVTSDM
jgi:hypothetical protein